MALFESVHNYYEHLVMEQIRETLAESDPPHAPGYLEDVACVALNRLPPRYVREDVDTGFYLSAEERETMDSAVNEAVKAAVDVVNSRPEGPARGFTRA